MAKQYIKQEDGKIKVVESKEVTLEPSDLERRKVQVEADISIYKDKIDVLEEEKDAIIVALTPEI